MRLYAVKFHETDGYTYFSDSVLGIFDEESKADELILRLVEKNVTDCGEYGRGNIDNYSVYTFALNATWEETE